MIRLTSGGAVAAWIMRPRSLRHHGAVGSTNGIAPSTNHRYPPIVAAMRDAAPSPPAEPGAASDDETLRRSEARFRALVEQAADIVFLHDHRGVVTWCSPAVTRVLGLAPHEVVGRTSRRLVHRADRAFATDAYLGALALPGVSANVEFRARHRDGSERLISAIGVNRLDDPIFGAFVGSWHDITEQRAAERVLESSEEQLRLLTQRLQVVRDEEQARLSRELHDRLGHSLTMLKLSLSRLDAQLAAQQADTRAQSRAALAEVDEAIETTRHLSSELRPPMLDDFGLAAALEWATQRFTKRTGIACTLDLAECTIERPSARALFAITQEALTNVVRHAQAQTVVLRLALVQDAFELAVMDDGVGVPPGLGDTTGGLGLLGMRERAASIGASVRIHPRQGGGTTVRIRLPRTEAA